MSESCSASERALRSERWLASINSAPCSYTSQLATCSHPSCGRPSPRMISPRRKWIRFADFVAATVTTHVTMTMTCQVGQRTREAWYSALIAQRSIATGSVLVTRELRDWADARRLSTEEAWGWCVSSDRPVGSMRHARPDRAMPSVKHVPSEGYDLVLLLCCFCPALSLFHST